MNDLFYEIIMQSSVLITGFASDKAMLLYNLFLSIFGLFELPELYVMDLAGQSSKYSRVSPAIYAPSDILDTLTQIHGKMCARIDGTAHDTAGHDTVKPIYMYIHNFDSIINQFSGKDKKQVQYIISDMVNRGQAANLHIIITADKCTNPLFSDFKSRIIAGKTDKKTAQKYFGAVARELTNFDCSDSGQAMSIIDGTIYKFNVPEIPESAIDDIIIMHILESGSDNAPTCSEIAPTAIQAAAAPVKPETIPVQADSPTEAATQAAEAEEPEPEQAAAENIIVRLLQNILGLILDIISSISEIITDNFVIKFAVILSIAVLNIVAIPVKLLYSLACSGFPGCFMLLCIVYMTVTTLLQCIR